MASLKLSGRKVLVNGDGHAKCTCCGELNGFWSFTAARSTLSNFSVSADSARVDVDWGDKTFSYLQSGQATNKVYL